jgi:hydroxymethylpyrimidine/phosphomethylpyrimidine kinase
MTAIALTIAGSDSGGGAGIQADLKTFSALGVYGASAITAITAQNTLGVSAVEDISPGMVAAQIEAVLSDIDVGAIKIGMVSRAETITAIAATLRKFDRRVVLDPVMVATSGDALLRADAMSALVEQLLPLALVATPNMHEAALLTGSPVAADEAGMIAQAEKIAGFGPTAVLVKGGHGNGADSTDLLLSGDNIRRFSAPRLATTHDHGTGCTLAAAITAFLARGHELGEAIAEAKAYLHGAIAAAEDLKVGRGRGPVHHFHRWWPADGGALD